MKRFYVSEHGNDDNRGRALGEAFASLPRARDAVREAKAQDGFEGAEVLTHFFFKEDRPKGCKNLDEVLLHGYWSWDWADRYIRPVNPTHYRGTT